MKSGFQVPEQCDSDWDDTEAAGDVTASIALSEGLPPHLRARSASLRNTAGCKITDFNREPAHLIVESAAASTPLPNSQDCLFKVKVWHLGLCQRAYLNVPPNNHDLLRIVKLGH
eukprot:6184815-Pleurochrysis_carterae.AAC.3